MNQLRDGPLLLLDSQRIQEGSQLLRQPSYASYLLFNRGSLQRLLLADEYKRSLQALQLFGNALEDLGCAFDLIPCAPDLLEQCDCGTNKCDDARGGILARV